METNNPNVIGSSGNITALYRMMLEKLHTDGEMQQISRVGSTIELRNAISVLENPYSRYITDHARKHSIKYVKAEFLWYMIKNRNKAFIADFADMWNKVSDDGVNVNSNYGQKVFAKSRDIYNEEEPYNQFDHVLNELLVSPDSRRAIWLYHDVNDILNNTKDFPCSIVSQFMIRNNKLHQTVYMRSCDAIFGWCNDIPAFSLFQEMLLRKLQVKYENLHMGNLTHIAGSLHIYEHHWKLLDNIYDTQHTPNYFGEVFPKMSITDVDQLMALSSIHDVQSFRNSKSEFLNYLVEDVIPDPNSSGRGD